MKSFLSKTILLVLAALTIESCSSGSSSGGTSSPVTQTEQSVAVFMPNASIAESALWVSTTPSVGAWNSYISGTTQSIVTVAANTNNILAFDGNNFILSNAQGGKFSKINLSSNIIESATLVAGSNQFVMYTANTVWGISNTGNVRQDILSGLSSAITSIVYLDSKFYAYTAASTVYSSTDGINWILVTSAQNIQPFTNVIKLNTGIYAAMTAPELNTSNPNLWLGSSPTSFNSIGSPLENFFGVPAQVNFIGSNGNNLLYINETISFTQKTIREYYISSSSQVTTNAVLQVIALPSTLSTQKPTGIYFANNNIFLTSGTVATTDNPSGNLIDPTGPTNLTAMVNATDPNITTQIVGSISLTNGLVYAQQGQNLITAPGTESNNNGALTMITNATNVTSPNYAVLPTGENVTYDAIVGNTTQYILILNNGGILINNESGGYTPLNAISNTSNESGSIAVTSILSAGALNSAYLVQATSIGSKSTGDLYYSQGGNSWTTISQTMLTAAHLGTLESCSVSINKYNNTFNITTSSGTYQTTTPATLSTWVAGPSPTPLFQINGTIYTLYPNSNNLGTLNGNTYKITDNALPQYYVTSGNVAYNGTNTVALAQAATIVQQADKVAGTNYIWTAANLNSNWTLNFASFYSISNQALPTEYFNVNPVLIWTGKIWITEGNGNTLLNDGTLPAAVYSSNNVTTWHAESSSNQAIMGVPHLF